LTGLLPSPMLRTRRRATRKMRLKPGLTAMMTTAGRTWKLKARSSTQASPVQSGPSPRPSPRPQLAEGSAPLRRAAWPQSARRGEPRHPPDQRLPRSRRPRSGASRGRRLQMAKHRRPSRHSPRRQRPLSPRQQVRQSSLLFVLLVPGIEGRSHLLRFTAFSSTAELARASGWNVESRSKKSMTKAELAEERRLARKRVAEPTLVRRHRRAFSCVCCTPFKSSTLPPSCLPLALCRRARV
jgi:hypothetical protein